MSLPPAADRLFDLPRRMTRDMVETTIAELRFRFQRQYGRPIGDLLTDLSEMRQLVFNPVAREERLRQTLTRLAAEDKSGPPPEHVPDLILLPVAHELWLVTPEARTAIPVLERCLKEASGDWCSVDDVDIHAAEHLLLDVTREWAHHRLDRTIQLQAGEGARMLPVAIAIPLLLIVNGNVGPERAMTQPKDPADQELLDHALVAPVRRFAEAIPGRTSDFSDRHLALYNGYALSEARRRLGDDLRLERIDTGGQHHPRKALYLAAGRQDATLSFLRRELLARGATPDQVEHAYDELVRAYGEVRPTLAAFGIVHDNPTNTRRTRSALIKAAAQP
jgi:hypothetical protein